MKTITTFLLLISFSMKSQSQCQLPPAIITPDGPTSFCSGGSVTLNANTGTDLTYQWKFNNVDIPGATSSFIIATEGGDYICVVTNSCGSSSNSITITVTSAPTAVVTAGGPTTFCMPGSVTLSVTAGVNTIYQWRVNEVGISGATASTYEATGSGNYDCIVANFCGNTFSNAVNVTVYTPPTGTITANQSTTFCDWSFAVLSAPSGFSYQWKNQGSDIPGATSVAYTVNVSGSYTCQIFNNCFSVLSNTIVITVIPTPVPVITAGGPTSYCIGGLVTLSTNPEPPGAGFSYQWYVNGGSPVSGATNSSLVVSGSAGNYSCIVSNVCGTVESNAIPVSVSQIIPATPGMITGNAKPCPLTTEIYSVSPSPFPDVAFNWTVPAGASITGGQGTNSITVDYTSAMTTGNVTVYAYNPCGTSNTKSKKIGKNNRCGARASAPFDAEQTDVMIYPNPAYGHFNILIKNEAWAGARLMVHDLAGRIVEQIENIRPGVTVEFGHHLVPGIYQVEIVSGAELKVFRLTKTE